MNKTPVFLAVFPRHWHLEKCRSKIKTDTDSKEPANTGKNFAVPVVGHLISISTGLVSGPPLYPGAGAAERPLKQGQEIL
jgi:hypothetical protein